MITESLSSKEGLAGRVGQASENSPQIGVLSESKEHLRGKEELDVAGRGQEQGKSLEREIFGIALPGRAESWGEVMGRGRAVPTERASLRTGFASSAF